MGKLGVQIWFDFIQKQYPLTTFCQSALWLCKRSEINFEVVLKNFHSSRFSKKVTFSVIFWQKFQIAACLQKVKIAFCGKKTTDLIIGKIMRPLILIVLEIRKILIWSWLQISYFANNYFEPQLPNKFIKAKLLYSFHNTLLHLTTSAILHTLITPCGRNFSSLLKSGVYVRK